MSDAGELAWSEKTGRKGGSPGMTRGASVTSGLSEHSQIGGNDGTNEHGQGQRPKQQRRVKMSHGGKSFTSC